MTMTISGVIVFTNRSDACGQHSDISIRFSYSDFLKRALVWRLNDILVVFTAQSKNLSDFYFRSNSLKVPITLNMRHMLHPP